jgi:hypothetical protein
MQINAAKINNFIIKSNLKPNLIQKYDFYLWKIIKIMTTRGIL